MPETHDSSERPDAAGDEDHGLTVEQVRRYQPRGIPAGSEPCIETDLPPLDGVSFDAIAAAVKSGDDPEETLRRVAPSDGTQLLVAASFQSAI